MENGRKCGMAVVIVLLIAGISNLYGETTLFDSLNVSFVGNWPFGPCYAVTCDSVRDIVFCGSGGGVYVLDVSTPSIPVKISDAIRTRERVRDLFYDYTSQRLYIAAEDGGLEIWEVINPLSPECLDCCSVYPEDALSVFVSGYYAYVADFGLGFWVIDISEPSNPRTTGYCYVSPFCGKDIVVSGEFAFVAVPGYLRVIDVSVPSNPQWIGSCEGGGQGICLSGDYAFVAGGCLRIVDISNPSNPYEVGNCPMPRGGNGVALAGSYAYVTEAGEGGNGSLRVIDITDVSQPVEIGHFSTLDSLCDVCVLDSFAYIVGRVGLKSIDVSTPSNPQEIGCYPTTQFAYRVFVSDSFAYITSDFYWFILEEAFSGFRIINISMPSNPQEIGFFSSADFVQDIFVADGFAYLANYSDGLRIVDVSDPSSPQEAGYYDTPGNTYGVFVQDTLAFIADEDTFRVVNVATPSNPQEMGRCKPQDGAYRVFVSGSYAYIVDFSGLSVVDISIPSNPQEVGYCTISYGCCDIHVSGFYAYIADDNGWLHVIDISTPTSPFKIGSIRIPENVWDVYVSEPFAYLAADGRGLSVVDISTPSDPQQIGYYYSCGIGDISGVFAAGSFVYVAAYESGLQVYRNLLADNIEEQKDAVVTQSKIRLIQNPVKGDFVEIRLVSPAQGRAEIILYNQIGQRLKTYRFNQLNLDENRLRIDAKGLPCGIYFLTLNGMPAGKVVKVK
jgi:hypothetical protein